MTHEPFDPEEDSQLAPEKPADDQRGAEAISAAGGAGAGAGVGAVVGGPVGAVVGGAIGAIGGAIAGEVTEGEKRPR